MELRPRPERFGIVFFKRVLKEYHANVLLTAHHGDDLVETVIMKLIRGGQLESLTGISSSRPFATGMIVRPLLSFSKTAIRDFAVAHHIRWFEDKTNSQLTVQRNRIRHQVVPLLKKRESTIVDARVGLFKSAANDDSVTQ